MVTQPQIVLKLFKAFGRNSLIKKHVKLVDRSWIVETEHLLNVWKSNQLSSTFIKKNELERICVEITTIIILTYIYHGNMGMKLMLFEKNKIYEKSRNTYFVVEFTIFFYFSFLMLSQHRSRIHLEFEIHHCLYPSNQTQNSTQPISS